ncbi:MAG: hypothetical protein M1834_002208 [Cirrosporium novae-zelandiae]|nr:MAG: hypothetical protein M1834_002208 [Cirrosporium novae-zelandiae]
MNGGPSVIQRSPVEKSNTELVNSLRASFLTAQEAVADSSNGDSNCPNSSPKPIPASLWTTRNGDTIYIPSLDFSNSGLSEERSQYDITVKLFYLPSALPSDRCQHTREAVDIILKALHIPSIDLLIVSFPDISFDADDDNSEEGASDTSSGEELDTIIQTWGTLEELHSQGLILQLGLAEFGSERLARFLPRVKVRPTVDQINVRDCCVVPKPLILYAKQEKIELLTHNDCTNILPQGTTRELLGTGDKGAGVLGTCGDGALCGDIEPQWVVKYTAVVKDRGVIENKGYFAVAELR